MVDRESRPVLWDADDSAGAAGYTDQLVTDGGYYDDGELLAAERGDEDPDAFDADSEGGTPLVRSLLFPSVATYDRVVDTTAADIGSEPLHPYLLSSAEVAAVRETEGPIGVVSTELREVPDDPSLQRVVVGMNSNAVHRLKSDDHSVLVTGELSGCSVVGVVADMADGTRYNFISHVDPLADYNVDGRRGEYASITLLRHFVGEVEQRGVVDGLRIAAAYDDAYAWGENAFSRKQWDYGNWSFPDRLQAYVNHKEFSLPVRLAVRTYQPDYQLHTFASAIDDNGANMYFDGEPIFVD